MLTYRLLPVVVLVFARTGSAGTYELKAGSESKGGNGSPQPRFEDAQKKYYREGSGGEGLGGVVGGKAIVHCDIDPLAHAVTGQAMGMGQWSKTYQWKPAEGQEMPEPPAPAKYKSNNKVIEWTFVSRMSGDQYGEGSAQGGACSVELAAEPTGQKLVIAVTPSREQQTDPDPVPTPEWITYTIEFDVEGSGEI